MKKSFLSLALASALCLSLTVPSLAANQSGDTAVTDAKGNTHTLSNPILYTVSPSEVQKIDRSSMEMYIEDEPFSGDISEYLNEHYWPTLGTVYAVPENTVVTLSPNVLTATVFELDLTWKNGVGYADEFSVILYPGFSSVTLNGSGYILTVDLESSVGGNNTPDNSNGSGGSSGSVGKVPEIGRAHV